MNVLIPVFILSFSYDVPLFSIYSKWATIKVSDIIGIAILFWWSLSHIFRRFNVKKCLSKQLWWYFIICVVSSVPTFLFMAEEKGSFLALAYSGYWILKMLEFILFYLMMYEFFTERIDGKRFLLAFWIGGIIVATYGLLESFDAVPHLWGELVLTPGAITSTLSWHHGILGMYMIVMFFLTLGLYMREEERVLKMFLLLSLCLFLYVEIISLRRSSWVGMGIGIFLWTILIRSRQGLTTRNYIVIALSLFAIIGVSMYSEPTKERLELFEGLMTGNIYSDVSSESFGALDVRKNILSFFIEIFLEHPSSLIFGRGFMSSPMRYEFAGAHNQFFDVFHDSGLVGLVIFLWLIYTMLKICWTSSLSAKDDWQLIYLSAFVMIIALIASSLTGGFFSVAHVSGNFLGFLLSLLAVIFASRQDTHEQQG